MADKPIPGRMVQPKAAKVDLKGIIGPKSKNLAGTAQSGGLNPKTKPGKASFDTVRRITGQGRNR